MAKITKYGGPSDRTVEIDGPVQHALSRRPQLGVVKSSGTGISSQRSSESDSKKNNEENQFLQPPAQTTDSPSKPEETPEASTVHSTDGNTPETPKAQSAKKVATPKKGKGKKDEAQTRVVSDDEDEFDEPVDLSGHDDAEDEFK